MRVRPTSDRLRETLFNIIAYRIEGASFLDLCAGSGAVGIEALSRGASHATFVEQSRQICNLIKANLELCSISSVQANVERVEVVDFLRQAIRRGSGPWDIVFFDPPYTGDYDEVMNLLGSQGPLLLSNKSLVVVEHHHKVELPELAGSLRRQRKLKQGDSILSFYQID
jgi:16S rRNA (guanine966-N2)-methyltransferase